MRQAFAYSLFAAPSWNPVLLLVLGGAVDLVGTSAGAAAAVAAVTGCLGEEKERSMCGLQKDHCFSKTYLCASGLLDPIGSRRKDSTRSALSKPRRKKKPHGLE